MVNHLDLPSKVHVRTTNGRVVRTIVYLYPCRDCGAERWKPANELHQEMCGHCQRVAAASLAWQATLAKLGLEGAAKRLADRFRDQPSEPERIVMQWLSDSSVEYSTQGICYYTLDDMKRFFLIDIIVGDALINIDGYWHRHDERKMARDRLLDQIIPGVLHISDIDIYERPEEAAQAISAHIGMRVAA